MVPNVRTPRPFSHLRASVPVQVAQNALPSPLVPSEALGRGRDLHLRSRQAPWWSRPAPVPNTKPGPAPRGRRRRGAGDARGGGRRSRDRSHLPRLRRWCCCLLVRARERGSLDDPLLCTADPSVSKSFSLGNLGWECWSRRRESKKAFLEKIFS